MRVVWVRPTVKDVDWRARIGALTPFALGSL